jgi:hypothetical protein
MPLLDIVRSVALKVGVTVPAVAVGSNDQNIQQIIGFANEAGQELAARYDWQELTRESTFTTVATESQGSITTITGQGFGWVLNETMWDRSTKRPVFGPKVAAEWQQLKAQFVNGPWTQYRIRGNQVLFIPVPAAGDAIFFEWVSKFWVANTAVPTIGTQQAYGVDSDVSILDERLITLDTVWRYKQTKRLAYDEDFDKAQAAIIDAISRNASKPTLNLAGSQGDFTPGIWVPAGSWNH